MVSKNDITGDKIQTKGVLSKEGGDRFDAIFRKKPIVNSDDKWDEKRIDIIGSNGNIGYEEEK